MSTTSKIVFPVEVPTSPFRRAAKSLLGALLAKVFPGRAKRIAEGDLPERLGTIDRLVILDLVERYRRDGRLGELGHLHDWMWKSPGAVAFHRMAEERFDTWWKEDHDRILGEIEKATATAPAGTFHTVCEIGCGAGLVLADAVRRIPGVTRGIGLDMSEEQIARDRVRFAGRTELEFHAADAASWIPRNAGPGYVYLTNAGVLEYFSEQKLAALFRTLATDCAPSVAAFFEPVEASAPPGRSVPYGSERSWSHDYRRLLEAAGFVVTSWEECRLGEASMIRVVATAGVGAAGSGGVV